MIVENFRLLLRMEWMKIWCRLNFVFSSIVFLLVLVQVAFLVRIDISGSEEALRAENIYRYAARYTDNLAFTFIPVLLLVNIALEFDYAIVQRSLVSGISRPSFFNGKLIQLGLFSLFAVLLAIIFSMLTAVIYKLPVAWDSIKLFMYFVVSFCLGSLGLMLAFIMKRRFTALSVFVVCTLLENIIVALTADKALLLPFQTCSRLLRQGIYEWRELVMAGVYTVMFLAMAYQVFRQGDLK